MTEYHHVDFEQYLKPEYWDGHYINDGDAVRSKNIEEGTRWPDARFACLALNNFFAEGGPADPFVITSFGKGDVFSPSDHNPGAIVRTRWEHLIAKRSVKIDRDALQGVSLPPPAELVDREQNIGGKWLALDDGNSPRAMVYQQYESWGVVTPAGKRRALLSVGLANLVIKDGGVVVNRHRMNTPHFGPIEVGEVTHDLLGLERKLLGKRTGYETVERMRSIEVCRPGTPESPEKSSILGFLGRLGFSHG